MLRAMRFRDRADAGRQLGRCLVDRDIEAPVVLGLARGGVSVYRGIGLGAFAERVLTPASGAIKIAPDVPLEVACVIGCAAARPGTAGILARVPTLMKTHSPPSSRVLPAFSSTRTVFGPVNRASPMTSSAPLVLNLPRCISTSSATICRLRRATPAMSTRMDPVTTPRPLVGWTSETAFAL